MAAPYNPPKRGEDFLTYISLYDMATPGTFRVNPTLASTDFSVSKDGGAFAPLTSTPVVEPTTTMSIRLWLSATEMAADNVLVRVVDQTTPKEWADFALSLVTASST
jgi:hypothetical protein